MTHTRRPISLVASVTLGLGTTLLVLLAGSPRAAAAPAPSGLNPPILNKCFARDDSAVGTVYQSADASAVRSAVAAAVTSDTVRLAGTCNGVAAQGGTTQTVLINKALTLIGGYTTTNWVTTFPLTQPTVLDAQGLGRVITASADITLGALTIQNGQSSGGDGGGIFAGGNLTSIGALTIQSNTTGIPTAAALGSGPGLAPVDGTGDGGGAYVEGNYDVKLYPAVVAPLRIDDEWANNVALGAGGGLNVMTNGSLLHTKFTHNTAGLVGGGAHILGILHGDQVQFHVNSGVNGGGLYTESGVTIQFFVFDQNNASFGGGGWAGISFQSATGSNLTFSNNTAAFGGGLDLFELGANVSDSDFDNNTAGQAGGGANLVNVSGTFINNKFMRNTAPEGRDVAASRELSPLEYVLSLMFQTDILEPHAVAAAGSALAPTPVLTGGAFASAGVSLFITDTIVSGYSLDFQTDSGPSSTIHGDYNLYDTTPVISGTHVTTGTHSLVGNPLFADAAGHLSAGSPAIDHGIDLGVNLDLDLNHRPSGHGFDIGAYEFQVALNKLFLPLVRR